jgi:hypothetical protein
VEEDEVKGHMVDCSVEWWWGGGAVMEARRWREDLETMAGPSLRWPKQMGVWIKHYAAGPTRRESTVKSFELHSLNHTIE